MDGALGFNTFEKQDKVLVGLNGGMDAAVTVRILQEQGFAVQAALVHFAGMADDAWRPRRTPPSAGCNPARD